MNRAFQADPQDDEFAGKRSVFRLSMISGEPVYLLLTMDGISIDPVVNELGGGGARLVTAKHFEKFDEGQLIGPAILVLPGEGMPVVYPVVRWKKFPAIGIEFMGLEEKDKEMILRFLFKVERRMVRSKPRPGLRKNLR